MDYATWLQGQPTAWPCGGRLASDTKPTEPRRRRLGLLEDLLGINDHLVAWVLPPFDAIF